MGPICLFFLRLNKKISMLWGAGSVRGTNFKITYSLIQDLLDGFLIGAPVHCHGDEIE